MEKIVLSCNRRIHGPRYNFSIQSWEQRYRYIYICIYNFFFRIQLFSLCPVFLAYRTFVKCIKKNKCTTMYLRILTMIYRIHPIPTTILSPNLYQSVITTRSLFVRSKQLQLFFSHFFFSFLFFKLIYSHGFHPVYTTRIFLELISQRFSAVYSPPCHFCSRNIPRLSPRRRNRSTIFFIYARRFIDDCTRQRLRANGSGNGRRSAVGKTVLYYFSRGR